MLDKLIAKAGRDQRGFTLIELLIVVAIIAILAAVAIPNFLNARARATLSNVKGDLKNISTSLETYMADNDQYPDSLAGLEPDYMTTVPDQPEGNGAYNYETDAGNDCYLAGTALNAYGTGAGVAVYVTNGAGVSEGANAYNGDCAP